MGRETVPKPEDGAQELLRHFLATGDEREARRLLERLLQDHADPVIRAVLRRKMGVYLDSVGGSARNAAGPAAGTSPRRREVLDAEDIQASAVLSLLEHLWALKGSAQANPIQFFHAYVAGIAARAFALHMRRLYPERHRLYRKFWDLAHGRTPAAGFALWTGRVAGEILCGFQDWQGQPLRHTRSYGIWQTQPFKFQREVLLGDDPRQIPFPDLVARVLDWVGGPMDVDHLLNGLAELLGVKEGEPADG